MIVYQLPDWDQSSNPNERNELKKFIVAEWVAEYRLTTIGILASRLKVTVKSSARFWRQLLREGILIKVTNPSYTLKDPLVRLGPAGFSLLEGQGLNRTLVQRKDRAESFQQLGHILGMQKAIIQLGLLDGARKITYSVHEPPRHLKKERIKTERDVAFRPEDDSVIPDSIIEGLKGGQVAIEFELTKKSNPRYVYWIFRKYALLFNERKLAGVYFIFDDDNIKQRYEKLWNCKSWTFVTREKIGGGYYYKKQSGGYEPSQDCRKRFAFRLSAEGEKKKNKTLHEEASS